MKKMYTVMGENPKQQQLVQVEYTDIETDNFKSAANGYIYYIYNKSEWLQDRWNFQLMDYKEQEFFLEIPIEDYVIKGGKLIGFCPYHGLERLKKEILPEEFYENILWIALNQTEEIVDNGLKFTKKIGEAYSAKGEVCYKTVWKLYFYSLEGRLGKSNVAFRWDEKSTLTILGNMRMPVWEENEFTPWDYYADQIKNLIVSPGVTVITKKSFRKCKNLETVFIPATIEVVEEGAFDIQTKVCKVLTFSGSVAANYQWTKNIDLSLLDINKDAVWIQEQYGINISEEYHNYWKRRFEQLDVIESDVRNRVQKVYKELQLIMEDLQKREQILKLLEKQPCNNERDNNEWRRMQQRREYSAIINNDIRNEIVYILETIKDDE